SKRRQREDSATDGVVENVGSELPDAQLAREQRVRVNLGRVCAAHDFFGGRAAGRETQRVSHCCTFGYAPKSNFAARPIDSTDATFRSARLKVSLSRYCWLAK